MSNRLKEDASLSFFAYCQQVLKIDRVYQDAKSHSEVGVAQSVISKQKIDRPVVQWGTQDSSVSLDGACVQRFLPRDKKRQEQSDLSSYVRTGDSPELLARLRRQEKREFFPQLDLHGLTAAEALPRVSAFLERSSRQGCRCVKLIHGKGLGSRNGAVLGPLVRVELSQMPAVLAFCDARPEGGGSGAVIVLIGKAF